MRFTKAQAIPLSKLPAKVLIRWETNISGPELKDFEFSVMRQVEGQDGRPGFQDVDIDGKPNNPKAVSLNPKALSYISAWIDGLDFPWFVDFSETLKSLTQASYYKVVCRNKNTQETYFSEEFSWEGELDLVGMYIVDETNFLLKDTVGVPCAIYQRKRGGIACTKCFDHIQKKRLSSSCRSCYGTNWVGGFFNPIDTYVDLSPNPRNANVELWGEVNQNETQALMSNFPTVSPGDLIRELRDNRMWRVTLVAPTEKRRCQMLQMVRLSEVKSGDIEYSIPNDERFQLQKIEELNQIKEKREF